jgi:hypothetical protein
MYKSPQDFAAAIYATFRTDVPSLSSTDHLDTEWKRIRDTEFQKSRFGKIYSREEAHNYLPLLDEIWKDIIQSIPQKLRVTLQASIALGVLDTGNANASIYWSNLARYYAIFLNLGLIQLLNHYLKLLGILVINAKWRLTGLDLIYW